MILTVNVLFDLGGVIVSEIGLDYVDEVQALLERCADYTFMVTGEPVEPEDGIELLSKAPPGKEIGDKCMLGIFYQHEGLIGVLDAVKDYPTPGEWFIGLLLLDPHERGRGIGEQATHAFETWAGSNGACGIQLGVVAENTGAMRFWSRLGYQPIEQRTPVRFGSKDQVIHIFRKELSPNESSNEKAQPPTH